MAKPNKIEISKLHPECNLQIDWNLSPPTTVHVMCRAGEETRIKVYATAHPDGARAQEFNPYLEVWKYVDKASAKEPLIIDEPYSALRFVWDSGDGATVCVMQSGVSLNNSSRRDEPVDAALPSRMRPVNYGNGRF